MLQAHKRLGQPESFFSGDKDSFLFVFSNQSEDAEIVVGLTAGPTAPN